MTESTLLANKEERTLEGLLLPYNERGQTNLGPLMFASGVVTIPADADVVTLNLDHDREQPVGRAVSLTETEAGITALFRIARTEEGDSLLDRVISGDIKALSAEVRGVLKDGVAATAGVLFGAAVVAAGAFPSAGFFARVEEPEEEQLPETDQAEATPESVISKLQALLESLTPRAVQPAPEASTADAAEETTTNTTEPETAEEEDEPDMATPNTLAAGAADKEELGASKVFELISKARMNEADETMLAALSQIKISGSGALPANGVLQPTWLGEIWANRSYERRYHQLIKNGSIVAMEEKGFKLATGSELVQSWAGNLAELPGGTATTSIITGDPLVKWGFVVEIAREFFDIPAGRPVVEAFIREIVNSYARVTDKYALQKIYAAAGAAVVHDTYPAGYSVALGKLIQGIDTIDDTDVSPSFVIASPDVYTELRRTPFQELPEFVSFGFGRQGGTADGVTVLRDKIGVLQPGEILVGSREFAHINELGGAAPLQLDAVSIANGGLDRAVVGYSQFMTEYPEGAVIIGDAE